MKYIHLIPCAPRVAAFNDCVGAARARPCASRGSAGAGVGPVRSRPPSSFSQAFSFHFYFWGGVLAQLLGWGGGARRRNGGCRQIAPTSVRSVT